MNQYQVQELEPFEPTEGKHYLIIETVNSCILRKQISDHFQKYRPDLKEVHNVDDCNVILVFCHIVSRAGTDIDAALNKLNACSASKPAIFMVFHHTFDLNKTVPDSSRHVTRRNTLTVDCLFYEDTGLLKCDMNEQALKKIVRCFKYQECCLRMCMSYLCCCCRWIFGKLQALCNAMCNCFRRGTDESGSNDERRKLIEDEGKNV